jgi:hypothetical protein
MNLVDSLTILITEGVANSTIKDAITNKHVCHLRYMNDDKLPRGSEHRVIQPVAYGMSNGKKPNPVVRAYQTSGPSLKVNEKGVPLPDWRLFRVDRMNSFAPVSGEGDEIFTTFDEPPMYNKVGDKSMSRMDYNSKF